MMIFSLPSPIPYEPNDHKTLVDWYRGKRLIPAYGNTAAGNHSFLKLLQTLTGISPSFGTVMADRLLYQFGLNVNITARNIPGLANDVVDLSFYDQLAYKNYINQFGIGVRSISKHSRRIEQHLEQCGNAYLKVVRIREGSAVRYMFSVPHYTHCIYTESDDPGREFILESTKVFDYSESERSGQVYLVTQYGEPLQFARMPDGTDATIIHIKEDANEDEGTYYGRPKLLQILPQLYIDFQVGNMASKVVATDIITKLLLTFEAEEPNLFPRGTGGDLHGDDQNIVDYYGQIGVMAKKDVPRSMFQRNMLVIKQLTTNLAGHPSQSGQPVAGIGGIQYPHGAKPPGSIPLELNRDVAYHKHQDETAAMKIHARLGWAPELSAYRQAKSNLGGNLLFDLFTIKNVSTIIPRQVLHQDMWNYILQQIWEVEGGPADFAMMGIEFPDTIAELKEQLKPMPTAMTVTNMSDEAVPNNNLNDPNDE